MHISPVSGALGAIIKDVNLADANHQFTYCFRWQAGGVIMWDNRFTLHYPINDFSGKRCRMIRTTTLCTDNERSMQ